MDRNGTDRLSRLRFLNRETVAEPSRPSKHEEYWTFANRYPNLPHFMKSVPEISKNDKSRISFGQFNTDFEHEEERP
jgi:hypothetical protein